MTETIHIMNPAAGHGGIPSVNGLSGDIYVTKKPGDAVSYLKRKLSDGKSYRIFSHGGDGTLNEVVNGIMAADAGDRVTLIPLPEGSGNDFYRVSSVSCGKTPCDLIKYNGKYVINVLNIGFDCAVAHRMQDFKTMPMVSGSFAYILGVAAEFIDKKATPMELSITDTDGNVEYYRDEYLLCAIANGKFYGGGFKAAPAADISDGALDVILVKNLSRAKFLALVSDYKKGTHINEETLECSPKLKDAFIFKRATKMKIKGAFRYAADGEIEENESGILNIEVVPKAVNVASDLYEKSEKTQEKEPASV